MEWKPIETAPKDADHVLVWDQQDNDWGEARWMELPVWGRPGEMEGGWVPARQTLGGDFGGFLYPTLWAQVDAPEERKNGEDAREKVISEMHSAILAAYKLGFMASGEGWNGEYPFSDFKGDPEDDPEWCAWRDAALDKLFPLMTRRRGRKRKAAPK